MRNLAQTAFLMVLLTLLSKLLGFIREMVTAGFYGTSYITDAYVMAVAIPGIIFGGIFGAVSTAFMPAFSKIRESKGKIEGDKFTCEIINMLFLLSIIAGLIGLVFSDQIVHFFARGFEGETASLTSFYIKITFFYVFFTSTASILGAYLQYKGVFIPQIIAGFVQNLGIIIVIVISGYTSHYYLAFGLLVGTAASFALQGYFAKKADFKYKLTVSLNRSVKELLALAFPVFIGSYVLQISTFVDKTLASGLPEGSVAALNYAMLLVTLVTGLTTNIFVTIIYPKITRANSLQDFDSYNNILSKGIMAIIIFSVPFTLGAILYNNEIVQIVYERGAFDKSATSLTASAFICYAVGLTFISLNLLFTKVYYSMHDMKTPIYYASIGVIIDVVLNFVLVKPMAHNGLALSTSISEIANCILLYYGIRKKYPMLGLIRSVKKVVVVVFASIISVGASLLLFNAINIPVDILLIARIIHLCIAVMFAGIIYLALLKLFQIEEINMIKQLIKR